MGVSFWQIAIVAVLLVLLFGRGKISGLMSDLAKGIKSFKQGMSEESVEASNAKREAIDAGAKKDEPAKS